MLQIENAFFKNNLRRGLCTLHLHFSWKMKIDKFFKYKNVLIKIVKFRSDLYIPVRVDNPVSVDCQPRAAGLHFVSSWRLHLQLNYFQSNVLFRG